MTFTIEQIRTYILSKDSLGDVLYNLSKENILKAQRAQIESDEIQIGDYVKPSRNCRKLYGDPDYMKITDIKNGRYLTATYSFWFEKHELELT